MHLIYYRRRKEKSDPLVLQYLPEIIRLKGYGIKISDNV